MLPTRKRPWLLSAAEFPAESAERISSREAVKKTFSKCWQSYRVSAWLSDELTPICGQSRNTFGGWGATLVDSLDALWILGMKAEFEEGVDVAVTIDFKLNTTQYEEIDVFETTI